MQEKTYTTNFYRIKKFNDKYFITTDHGSFCFLNKSEYNLLRSENVDQDPSLYKKLEEKEIILTNENIIETQRLLQNRNYNTFHGTGLHIIVITLHCNMKCIYCHASSKPVNESKYDMDVETAKKTVDFIFQTPAPSITIEFQGGEPLLNWEVLKETVLYAKKLNQKFKKKVSFSIVTNLSYMDNKKFKFILDERLSVCTSLDGPKQLHDFNRPYIKTSNYDEVTYWIKRFNLEFKKNQQDSKSKKRGNIINALVTLTRKSLEYPKEIVDEYINQGIPTIHLRNLNNLGTATKTWKNIDYTAEEFLEFWKTATEYLYEQKNKGTKIRERIVELIMTKLTKEFDPNFLDLRSPCGAIIGQIAYNYNGDIYPCDEARMLDDKDFFHLGNVHKNSYEEIATQDKSCKIINSSINDQYVCDSCVYKPYCGVCPVCNYAEQGNIIGKIPETSKCKITMGQFDWVINKILKK
jgi:uncharacterized protein